MCIRKGLIDSGEPEISFGKEPLPILIEFARLHEEKNCCFVI